MWQAAMEARRWLAEDWGVSADAWSVTSYNGLRADAISAERWNRLHPGEEQVLPYVTAALERGEGPVVAVSDFLRSVPDQVSRWVPARRRWVSLGTDGFGRSDNRSTLRRFFEIDAAHVVVAALSALTADGSVEQRQVAEAIAHYDIDPHAAEPFAV
jgi:pyruvate dehydrogenase E1 component